MCKTVKMKMGINEWNEVVRLCQKLNFDYEPYKEVYNFGKLIFDLVRMDIFPSEEHIPPDPADYMLGGKWG